MPYQEQQIALFCAREGFEIVRTYSDLGRTGLTARGRKGLARLLADVCETPPFRTLLIADPSRWGRYQDPDEAAHYEFLCRAGGVDVRYCNIDPGDVEASPADHVLKSVTRLLAAEFSRQRSEHTQLGLARVTARGGWGGGLAPFGFGRVADGPCQKAPQSLRNGELKPHPSSLVRLAWGPPEEVALVRRIFRCFLEEVQSPPTIARRLDAEAAPCRGGAWTPRRVRAVLQCELVIGVLATGKSVWRLRERERRVAPQGWRRQTILPAMIPPADFHEAQLRLASDPGRRHGSRELLADLRRLLARHGRLDRALVKAEGRFTVRAYGLRFGALQTAFRAVGFRRHVRDRQHTEPMDRGEMIERLAGLLAQTGYLSGPLLWSRGDVPSPAVLRRAFGSLDAAYAAAGFTTDRSEQLRLAYARRGARHPDLPPTGSEISEVQQASARDETATLERIGLETAALTSSSSTKGASIQDANAGQGGGK